MSLHAKIHLMSLKVGRSGKGDLILQSRNGVIGRIRLRLVVRW